MNMKKAIYILNCHLRSTGFIAVNVEKHIATNLHLDVTQYTNVERNHNSIVPTVHTRPRETAICFVTFDLNFLAGTSVSNQQ